LRPPSRVRPELVVDVEFRLRLRTEPTTCRLSDTPLMRYQVTLRHKKGVEVYRQLEAGHAVAAVRAALDTFAVSGGFQDEIFPLTIEVTQVAEAGREQG
jgi:hypothetical protein